MFKGTRQEQYVRLDKQEHLPTIDQIKQVYSDTIRNPGRITELPFGENWQLSACRKQGMGGCEWLLQRFIAGGASETMWNYDSNDIRWIHAQIVEKFPRWNPNRRRIVDPTVQDTWSPFPNAEPETKATMEGDLSVIRVPNLLRSISREKLTGRLVIRLDKREGRLYFSDGTPIHCSVGSEEGEAAFRKLVLWTSGKFAFYNAPRYDVVSLFKPLDLLLLEAAAAPVKGPTVAPLAEPGKPRLAAVDRFEVHSLLANKSTGALTFPALLYMTDLEFVRSSRYNRFFALVLLQVGTKGVKHGQLIEPLTGDSLSQVAHIIQRSKRSPDLFGHYDTGFGLLLPEADRSVAELAIDRLIETITSIPPAEWTGWTALEYAIGVAGAPEDAQDIDSLFGMASQFGYKNSVQKK